MSNMRYVEKLLDGVDVEWKALGEVATVTIGEFVHKNNQDPAAKYPVYNGGVSHTGYYNKYNNTGDKIIISARGANAGFVNRISKPYWAGNSCYSIGVKNTAELNWTFIYYFLKHSENKLIDDQQKGGIPAISKKQIEIFQIPIPCPEDPGKSLEIQSEIVRILDAFTALTTELTTELTARKKQYNFYRDQLLTFEEGSAEWKTLGDIGEVRMCKRIFKEQTSDTGDIPFYKIGTFGKVPDAFISRELFDEFREKYSYPKTGEVLISASGTIGRAVIFDGQDAYFQDSNIVWIENDERRVLNKYLFYFYQVAEWNPSDGGVIKRLYNDNLKKVKIPIPYSTDPEKSLAEQERIVTILDKFDTLTNSIRDGLPREIELRQKQYEYYREQILSFPKVTGEV